MVSNLVSTIPSMRCGSAWCEWSARAALNFTSWREWEKMLIPFSRMLGPKTLGTATAITKTASAAHLIDGLVPYECLPHEEHEVGRVDGNQLGKGAHERLVVLHSARRVHQHHVDARRQGVVDGLQGDA